MTKLLQRIHFLLKPITQITPKMRTITMMRRVMKIFYEFQVGGSELFLRLEHFEVTKEANIGVDLVEFEKRTVRS